MGICFKLLWKTRIGYDCKKAQEKDMGEVIPDKFSQGPKQVCLAREQGKCVLYRATG